MGGRAKPDFYSYTSSVVTHVIEQIPLDNHISQSTGCRDLI